MRSDQCSRLASQRGSPSAGTRSCRTCPRIGAFLKPRTLCCIGQRAILGKLRPMCADHVSAADREGSAEAAIGPPAGRPTHPAPMSRTAPGQRKWRAFHLVGPASWAAAHGRPGLRIPQVTSPAPRPRRPDRPFLRDGSSAREETTRGDGIRHRRVSTLCAEFRYFAGILVASHATICHPPSRLTHTFVNLSGTSMSLPSSVTLKSPRPVMTPVQP